MKITLVTSCGRYAIDDQGMFWMLRRAGYWVVANSSSLPIQAYLELTRCR